ncbi:S8 family serine peptidase [Kitasatospora sp. NBC_01250]|uniref:S8 family serine peptidase n=1 Tax=unclassified Kitasatospora TaxID=2633591 RepID=UPI002E1577F6|nr:MULTISPECIES: S8 family serine peptidase [unclassified Kitasatospora]WSJ68846.1 S8 family serine peptidase [Kitasatospora sp. NBC_01302]
MRRRVAAALALTMCLGGGLATAAQAADTPRGDEWHLDALHMPEVWQTSTGAGVTVAVIDSGVKADLPDLVGQVLPGKDLSGLPGGVNTDPEGHGTGMASVIAGSGKNFDGKGAEGLAPGARILPIKVNTNSNSSTAIGAPASLKQIDEGITYAVDQGAKVISISQAIRNIDISPSDVSALQDAVNYAISKGRLIVAGAGNSGQEGNWPMYPSVASGVAAIAAFDEQGNHTAESEYGPQIALAGPGQDIISACIDPSGYCKSHGTSDATALVAATAAVLWQVHPDWTGNQILRVLMNTANKPNNGANRSDYIGFGNVSPRNAIHYTGDPGPADVNPLIAAGIDVNPPGSASASAPASPSAAASAPATGAAPTGSTANSASAAPVPATHASGKSSSSMPLIIGGAVLAVLVIGGVVFFVLRRKGAAATAPPAPGAPYGYPVPPQGPPAPHTPPAQGFGPPPAYGPGQPPYGQPPQQPPAQGNPYQQPQPGPYQQPPQG